MWIAVARRTTVARHAAARRFSDERRLRDWLGAQGVTGYAQSLLAMEQFGYPDFILATGAELIRQQYADRAHLKPIYDAVIEAATSWGSVVIQARKTFVSLVAPRRTFARVVPATRTRVDVGLRLEGSKPHGRLQLSRIHETMRLQVSLTSPQEVDGEVLAWMRRAYDQNR
jgi:Domain of unknown function (DUF5655)